MGCDHGCRRQERPEKPTEPILWDFHYDAMAPNDDDLVDPEGSGFYCDRDCDYNSSGTKGRPKKQMIKRRKKPEVQGVKRVQLRRWEICCAKDGHRVEVPESSVGAAMQRAWFRRLRKQEQGTGRQSGRITIVVVQIQKKIHGFISHSKHGGSLYCHYVNGNIQFTSPIKIIVD